MERSNISAAARGVVFVLQPEPPLGGRWWREAAEPKGWRCRNCYPPDHLRADQVVEVRT